MDVAVVEEVKMIVVAALLDRCDLGYRDRDQAIKRSK